MTTRSYLPIAPVDTDTGRNYSCVATNLAIPSGKSTTVTLNVHRKQFNNTETDFNSRSVIALWLFANYTTLLIITYMTIFNISD